MRRAGWPTPLRGLRMKSGLALAYAKTVRISGLSWMVDIFTDKGMERLVGHVFAGKLLNAHGPDEITVKRPAG